MRCEGLKDAELHNGKQRSGQVSTTTQGRIHSGTAEDSRIRAFLPQAALRARGPSGRRSWVTLDVRSAGLQKLLGVCVSCACAAVSVEVGPCRKHAPTDHRAGQEASQRKFMIFSRAASWLSCTCFYPLGTSSFHCYLGYTVVGLTWLFQAFYLRLLTPIHCEVLPEAEGGRHRGER